MARGNCKLDPSREPSACGLVRRSGRLHLPWRPETSRRPGRPHRRSHHGSLTHSHAHTLTPFPDTQTRRHTDPGTVHTSSSKSTSTSPGSPPGKCDGGNGGNGRLMSIQRSPTTQRGTLPRPVRQDVCPFLSSLSRMLPWPVHPRHAVVSTGLDCIPLPPPHTPPCRRSIDTCGTCRRIRWARATSSLLAANRRF